MPGLVALGSRTRDFQQLTLALLWLQSRGILAPETAEKTMTFRNGLWPSVSFHMRFFSTMAKPLATRPRKNFALAFGTWHQYSGVFPEYYILIIYK